MTTAVKELVKLFSEAKKLKAKFGLTAKQMDEAIEHDVLGTILSYDKDFDRLEIPREEP